MKKLSVALAYELNMDAPIVIATGKGNLANKIEDLALEHNIPIEKDNFLAQILVESEIGACIPYETWTAVAKIFAFLEEGIQKNWF